MKLSIRKFLLLNLLLAITAIIVLTAFGNYYLSQQDIQNNLDNLISQSALSIQALASNDIKQGGLASVQAKLNAIPKQRMNIYLRKAGLDLSAKYKEPYQFQIWDDQNNKLLLHSAFAPTVNLADDKTGFNDQLINNDLWRTFTIKDSKNQLTFVVGEHYDIRTQLARRITLDEIIIIFLTFPLSGLLIWIIVGGGLSSIGRAAKEVSQRAADHLEPVDLEVMPTEIKPLIDELNKLFLRLKQAFEREQRFAADAAHELRTPLAALKTMAQVALKTTDGHERHLQLQKVIVGVDRCTHVIQQLLTLCRVSPETATLENPTQVDLHKVASEVIGQLAPTAVDRKIEIELIVTHPNCVILGNATGLYALLRNLVDNAIRYTPAGGSIKVVINNTGKEIVLRVTDNGPGIPVELRARVFERFFRVLGTNTQGSGLGLAIVQQIVKLHKGQVVLSTPITGSGLEVEVRLPTAKGRRLPG